jgi:hypothetical protein
MEVKQRGLAWNNCKKSEGPQQDGKGVQTVMKLHHTEN